MPRASSTAITMIAASSNSEAAADFDFCAVPLPEFIDGTGPPGVPGRAMREPFFVERTLMCEALVGRRSLRSVAASLCAGIGRLGLLCRRRRCVGRALDGGALDGGALDGRGLLGSVDGRPRLGRLRIVQKPGLHSLLWARVAALAHTRALADTIAQVVELCAAHIAAGRQLDALDLGRVHREHALHADAEGLLAHREGLAHTVALALDDDPLENLNAPPGPLDHLEMHLHAIARGEARHTAQLGALKGLDYAAH